MSFLSKWFPTEEQDRRAEQARADIRQNPGQPELARMKLEPSDTHKGDFALIAMIADAKRTEFTDAYAIAYLLGYREVALNRTAIVPHEFDGMDSGLGMRAAFFIAGSMDASRYHEGRRMAPDPGALTFYPNFMTTIGCPLPSPKP